MGKVYVGNVKGEQGNSASITATENELGVLVTATSGDGTVTTAQVYNGEAIRPDAGKFYAEDGNVPSYYFSSSYGTNGFGQIVTDITMEGGIKNVGNGGFSYMKALNSIVFDDGDVPILGNYCFYGDSILETATVHPFSIGEYCFYDCSSLTSIDLSKVTEIKSYAFYNCVSLEKLDFTNESPLTLTGGNIFAGVTCEVDFSKTTAINTTDAPFYGAKCKKVSVNETWTSIPKGFFNADGSVTTGGIGEIDLKNVTTLGNNALRNSFANVDLSKITTVGQNAIVNVKYDGNLSAVTLFNLGDSTINQEASLQVDTVDLTSLVYLHSDTSSLVVNGNFMFLNGTKIKLGQNFKGFDTSSNAAKAGKVIWNAFSIYNRTQQVKVIVNCDIPIANVDSSASQNVEVYVPDASYEAWIAVTNSYFSSHMHKMSELS